MLKLVLHSIVTVLNVWLRVSWAVLLRWHLPSRAASSSDPSTTAVRFQPLQAIAVTHHGSEPRLRSSDRRSEALEEEEEEEDWWWLWRLRWLG